MWPSEEVATRLYGLANFGLIASLVVGVISTAFIVWMGNVKETYLRSSLSATSERAANATKSAAEALSQQEILKSENLKLEAQIQPRSPTLEQQREIADALISFKGRKVLVSIASLNDPESYNFGRQMLSAFQTARLDIMFSAGSQTGRQYTPIAETGVQIRWAEHQQDLGTAFEAILRKTGHIRKLSVKPGISGVSGPTEFLKQAVLVTVYPKPFDTLQ